MSWYKRLSVSVLLLLLLSVSLLFGFDRISAMINKDKFPPSGQFIKVGGYSLHYVCYGQGYPVIMYESGFGSDATQTWQDIATQTASKNKSCFYDRVGMGWSSLINGALSPDDSAEHLAAVINEVSPKQSVILVAHSFGGLIARRYSLKHKNRIVGIVFSDSAHDNQHNLLKGLLEPFKLSAAWLAKLQATIGLSRLLAIYNADDEPQTPWDARYIEQYTGTKKADHDLNYARLGGFKQPIDSQNYDLSDIPLVVLQHDPAAYPQGERFKKMGVIWDKMQHDIAALSQLSEIKVVLGARHDIPGDKPEAIVGAVESLLSRHF